MQDQVSAILEELLDDATIKAFRKAWPADPKVGAAEAASVAEFLTRPNGDECKAYIARLVDGLVGSQPALLAWLRALDDEDGFELRRSSKKAKDVPGPSRALELAISNTRTLEGRLKADQTSAYLDSKRERVRMLAAAALVHKLRDSVRAPAAIGPGWTLMQAVGERKNADLNRRLHQFGGNADFRYALAGAVEDAVSAWLSQKYGDNPPPYARAAEWKRSLPPGTDPVRYFSIEAVAAYRDTLLSNLDIDPAQHSGGSIDPVTDAGRIRSQHPPSPQPEASFSYYVDDRGERLKAVAWSRESIERLQALLPLLQNGSESMMKAAAARAFLRARARNQRRRARLPGDELEAEISTWVELGRQPPPHMRMQDAHLFEEEACSQYLGLAEDWRGLKAWRDFGFFPAAPSSIVDPWELYSAHRQPFPPTPSNEAAPATGSSEGST